MHAALAIHDVHKRYRAGVRGCLATVDVLRGVCLEVDVGQIVHLTGARGAGRSTLLRCAAGLLRPDAGTVSWFGQRAFAGIRPPGVSFVGDCHPEYGFLTVAESLEYFACVHEIAEADRPHRLGEALERVALQDLASVRVSLLSTAQRARLRLAHALITEPRVLLIDTCTPAPGERALETHPLAGFARELAGEGAAVVIALPVAPLSSDVRSARTVLLAHGELIDEPWRDPALGVALEVLVDDPVRVIPKLCALHWQATARGRFVRITLGAASPEEVLADCIRAGAQVRASRVVHPPVLRPVSRVAEPDNDRHATEE